LLNTPSALGAFLLDAEGFAGGRAIGRSHNGLARRTLTFFLASKVAPRPHRCVISFLLTNIPSSLPINSNVLLATAPFVGYNPAPPREICGTIAACRLLWWSGKLLLDPH
jgi:hypothetical protein